MYYVYVYDTYVCVCVCVYIHMHVYIYYVCPELLPPQKNTGSAQHSPEAVLTSWPEGGFNCGGWQNTPGMCVWRMILVWGVCGGGFFCGGFAFRGWQNTPGMCILECVRSLHRMCSEHPRGWQNTPVGVGRIRLWGLAEYGMCLPVWGDTYQAYSTCVGCVWRRMLGMCLVSTFTRGRTGHLVQSLMGLIPPPLFFLFP